MVTLSSINSASRALTRSAEARSSSSNRSAIPWRVRRVLPDLLSPTDLSRLLIAVAVTSQSAELIALRKSFSEQGIWRWADLRSDFSASTPIAMRLLDLLLCRDVFTALLLCRLAASPLLPFANDPLLLGLLLAASILVSVRWRGAFNGGSDYMTAIVLLGLLLVSIGDPGSSLSLFGMLYIAVQCCLSYFVAGITKLRAPNWRSGEALTGFLRSTIYGEPEALGGLLRVRGIPLVLSWGVILFECTFPLALVDPSLCLVYLAAGAFFHLVNAYVLGLNRFFWAWVSTYPFVYFLSTLLSSGAA